KLHGADKPIDFQSMFLEQEDTQDEDSLTLAELLKAMHLHWPTDFHASDIAQMINSAARPFDNSCSDPIFGGMLQGFFYPKSPPNLQVSAISVGRRLEAHVNNPVRDGQQMLTLRRSDQSNVRGSLQYRVEIKPV